MADAAAQQFEDGKVYLLSGETIKKIAKQEKISGVLGQIIVNERGGKYFIGFATEEVFLMVKNGVIEEYLIPARANPTDEEE